ncbi:tyrosine-type recombinase/integrase [Sinorhizobium medicae]|nr:tyrosine-type recombinase/integrase [Sinorhizobium medicae]MDX0874448.1 tyrosine-type recombinase/integrase [Sinorhizobium medicae]
MPFLILRDTGLPIEAPTFWITAHRRAMGSQPNTLFNELRSLMLLYLYADLRDIDIAERLSEGDFLELTEIIDLVNLCGWYLDDVLAALDRRTSNVITLARHIPKAGVQSGEKRNRLSVIRSFIEFTSAGHLSRLQAFPDRWALYRDMRKECLDYLTTYIRGIGAPNRDDVGKRKGLNPEVLKRLRTVIDPDHPENPFERQVRFRNFVMIMLFIELGIRRGELLGIKVDDCDVAGERGFVTIHRRPDDVSQTRFGVATKTVARKLELSRRTTQLVYEWIVYHRRQLPNATKGKDQYLIVTIPKANPMSSSNVNKTFEALRERVPGLPADVKPHVLRHSWNDTFSDWMDKKGISAEDEVKWRKKIMGWRSDATAQHYTRRTVEHRSNQVLREMHDNLDIRLPSEKDNA